MVRVEGTYRYCGAAHQSASVSVSIRCTSSLMVLSSSGYLCFPLLIGALMCVSWNLFGVCDEPASALLLDGGRTVAEPLLSLAIEN